MPRGEDMQFIIPCPIKLNLTLRITGRLENGFHDLCSLFMAAQGPETLTLNTKRVDNVRDSVTVHNINLPGRNILEDAADLVRNAGYSLPPLEISIWKQIPPGSGLGSGSGNAAAFLRWTRSCLGVRLPQNRIAELGCDVPFLYRGAPLSLVSGVGDKQEDLEYRLAPSVLILFPEWTSSTPGAYRAMDTFYGERWPRDERSAREEASAIIQGLSRGERMGLLPNDFTPVLVNQFPAYDVFFRAADLTGSPGYGITGSGSACFALFEKPHLMKELYDSCRTWDWVHKILALE